MLAKNQRTSCIYQIKNAQTERVYIGQSCDIAARWRGHRDALRQGKHINDELQSDREAYGEAAFEFSIIEEVDGWEVLCEAEARHWAAAINPYNAIPARPAPTGKPASPPIEPEQLLVYLTEATRRIQAGEFNDDGSGPTVNTAVCNCPECGMPLAFHLGITEAPAIAIRTVDVTAK